MQTNKMHVFLFNVLILFFVSSTCFEHLMFIIRQTICTCSLAVKNVEGNGLPDDEQKMFETCRREE